MYVPHQFKNENADEIREFVAQNGFGILISQTDARFLATHIPLELDADEQGAPILVGHLSRGNPQWKNFAHDSQVLVIFNGAQSYVSSSWYDHENVPTWNYIAVHIYGKIKIITGEKLLLALKKLVDKYEQRSAKPVSVATMSAAMLQKEMRGIVGFEVEITEIQAAYKLSQNRDDKNHDNITAELRASDDAAAHQVAAKMDKERRK